MQALFPTLTVDGQQVVSPKLGSACIGRVRKVLDAMPGVAELTADSDGMRDKLEAIDPIGWKLFQWINTSNRTFIVQLPPASRISALESVNCVHQYLMKAATPEKEEKFQALKQQHKTVFAFHGSRMECWHAIIRAGLKNVSGTAMMTAGQAHGAGTYTSPDMSTSLGYSQMHGGHHRKTDAQAHLAGDWYATPPKSWRAFAVPPCRRLSPLRVRACRLQPPLYCMAICEIIDTGSSIKRSGSIWVVPNNDHINTRFLLVWDANHMPTGGNASTVSMDAELRVAAERGADILDV